MKGRPGQWLLAQARVRGARFELTADGQIDADLPDRFPEDLLAQLKEGRDSVLAALKEEAEFRSALAQVCPGLGTPVVHLPSGETGHIWGISPHGVNVDFGPGRPIKTLDPRKVRMVEPGGQ